MFLGHIGAGLAAKRLAPRTSTAVLLGAPLLLDLLWPIFLLLDVERVAIDPGNTAVTPLAFEHYPFTHSLLATLGWSVLAAALFLLATRNRRGAMIVGALVLSHWLFDLVMHRPDLPVLLDGPYLGFAAWNSVALTLLIEFTLFGTGVILYQNATLAGGLNGRLALASLVGVLVLIYLGNVFGPPPPDARAIAIFSLALWLIPLWGLWLDRSRAAVRLPHA